MWITRKRKLKTLCLVVIPTIVLIIVSAITLSEIYSATEEDTYDDDGTLEDDDDNFPTCYYNEHKICKQCKREVKYFGSKINQKVKPCKDFYKFVCEGTVLTTKDQARDNLKLTIQSKMKGNSTIKEKPFFGFIQFCESLLNPIRNRKSKYDDITDTLETNFQINKIPEYFGPTNSGINFNLLKSLVQVKHFLDMDIFFSVTVVPHIEKQKYVLTISEKPQPSFLRRSPYITHSHVLFDPLRNPWVFNKLLINLDLRQENHTQISNVIRKIKNQLKELMNKYAGDSKLKCTTIKQFDVDFTMKFTPKSKVTQPDKFWKQFLNLLYQPLVRFNFRISYRRHLICYKPKTLNYLAEMYIWISKKSKKELELFMWYTVTFELLQYTPDFGIWSQSGDNNCMEMAMHYFNLPMSQLYSSNLTITKIKEMVSIIDRAFLEKIKTNPWIDTNLLQFVLDKFKNRHISAGYALEHEDAKIMEHYFSNNALNLDIKNDSLLTPILAKTIKANVMFMLHYVNVPFRKSLMLFSPLGFDFLLSHKFNLLRMHLGLARFPVYFGNHNSGKKVLTYALVGFLIARAIAASFDWAGIHHDGYGNPVQPKLEWSSKVYKRFVKTSECFGKIYKNFEDCNGREVEINDSEMLDKHMNDNVGLRFAYRAFKSLVDNQGCFESLNNLVYTDDQMFFIAFASFFCENRKCKQTYKSFEDIPYRTRLIRILQNSKYFAEAFNCKVGDPMRPRETQCGIW